jgi:hypothetical protein
MERITQMLSEAAIQEQQGRKEIAYYRYIAAALSTADIMAKLFVFETEDNEETFRKMAQIIQKSLFKAEELLQIVVEYSGEDLEALKLSGTQIAGRGAEPLVVETSEIFKDYPRLVQRYGNPEFQQEKTEKKASEIETEHIPLLPESRLRLNRFAVQYHAQLLMQKLAELDRSKAKEQANAIFLACCHHTLYDFVKVAKRSLELMRDMQNVEGLELRNELMTVDKIAAEVYLVDRLLFSRLNQRDLLESRLHAVNTVKPILDFYHFLVSFTIHNVSKCAEERQAAETIVFLVHVAERLLETYGDYHGASAVIIGLSTDRREARHLLPKKITMLLESLTKITSPEKHFVLCHERVLKHPHPIPPIQMLLEDVRLAKGYVIPKQTEKLLHRVSEYCLSKGFTSQRPDIQHWLLSYPFSVSFHRSDVADDGSNKGTTPALHSGSRGNGAEPVPELSRHYSERLESLNDDRFNLVLGVHAKY